MCKKNQDKQLKKHELEYLDSDTYYIAVKKDNTIEVAMPSNIKDDDSVPLYFAYLTIISVALDKKEFREELVELLTKHDFTFDILE